MKEKLFDLIIQKQNEFRNINLELNQIKNILNKKLILFDQVNKNLNMIMSFEKKAENDFNNLYKNMRIGDYTILDKAESMLMIYNPKTIKRHVMEIVNQDLIREIKRALEKKQFLSKMQLIMLEELVEKYFIFKEFKKCILMNKL